MYYVFRVDSHGKHDPVYDEEEEEDEEILGSDDDEQEDPKDYCKGIYMVVICFCVSVVN